MLSSLLAGYTRSDIVASLLFACVFALLGYRMSHRHRLVRGVTPWRLPSAVWAVICFVFQPIGLVVELLAQATTKPVAATRAPSSHMAHGFPAYPQRAGFAEAVPAVAIRPEAEPAPVATPSGPPPPAGDASGKSPLFGWYGDVTGRHEQRYWDGRRWSEFVRDGDVRGTDPI